MKSHLHSKRKDFDIKMNIPVNEPPSRVDIKYYGAAFILMLFFIP